MSRPRFHVPEAAPGARVALPDHAAHHAKDVLRLRSGDAVQVFDGSGAEFEGTIERLSRAGVEVHLGAAVAPRPESPVVTVLALPPLKGDRMELVIQKATELGVSAVWPVVTVRTDAAGRPALSGTRDERWHKVAAGAAEQCGRAHVPELAPTGTLPAVLERPFDGLRLMFVEREGRPLSTIEAPPAAVLILVGPPGGWEPNEVERAEGAGFHAVSLGPRILRTETAALAALSAVQVRWGDLG